MSPFTPLGNKSFVNITQFRRWLKIRWPSSDLVLLFLLGIIMTASKTEHITQYHRNLTESRAHMYIGRRLYGMSPVKSLTEKVVYSFTKTIKTNSPIFLRIELFNQCFHLLGHERTKEYQWAFHNKLSPLKNLRRLRNYNNLPWRFWYWTIATL